MIIGTAQLCPVNGEMNASESPGIAQVGAGKEERREGRGRK